jgi:hypothetical protein
MEGNKMDGFLDALLLPILRRIGSAVAGATVAVGATTEQVGTIEAALIALAGVAVDLYLSNRDAKKKHLKALTK